ncbi:MAG: cytochrome c-type biogenesis protein CcmH [Litoreibacter sp.]|nr:cytochrome c-type biogenesis protein CcmH [Litoreibacter sp.]
MKRLLLILCLVATPLYAVEPDEILDDPVLEERARAISADVRCVVCQNEPIDSSDAGVARDLRLIIRERLVAGDTDQEVFDYLVLRYGDFVLFNPPWKPSTYALWIGPFAILALGFIAVFITLYRKRGAVAPSLSAEEQKKLDALLKDKS